MKTYLVDLSSLLLIVGLAFGQSASNRKPTEPADPALCPFPDESGEAQAQSKASEQPGRPGMMCPMMGMMSGIPGGQPMKEMRQRMASMFAPSAEEISAHLSAKKSAFGLSAAQVKQITDAITELEQEKVTATMDRMMKQMQSGEMKCPCMPGSSK